MSSPSITHYGPHMTQILKYLHRTIFISHEPLIMAPLVDYVSSFENLSKYINNVHMIRIRLIN